MRIGPKYRAFMAHRADMEFLEGTTAAGKTTVGILKYMMLVALSPNTQHILSGLDLGTIEKNIITKPHGILDELGSMVEYKGNGSATNSIPHIVFRPAPGVERIVYVLGYADKARWKKALGGQYGCLFIDEMNIADMDFVREASMRCDYVMGTLNPDDPALPVYDEFINRATPVPGWSKDTPPEILRELRGEHANWSHWFFNFGDNVSLTQEKVDRIVQNVPEGTKLWKNKVLGLRGRATGLVFPTYDPEVHDMTVEAAKALLGPQGDKSGGERFVTFTAGLDTSYSALSADTIAMTFGAVTSLNRYVLLDCVQYNNRDLQTPLAPSDTVERFVAFLDRNKEEWGLARHSFVDSADQATLTELRKWKRAHPESMYVFEDAYKRVRVIDRIELQLAWMSGSDPAYRIVADRCKPYVRELLVYSWDEEKDSVPEDGNDHCIQSCQYSWLPYKDRIGRDR